MADRCRLVLLLFTKGADLDAVVGQHSPAAPCCRTTDAVEHRALESWRPGVNVDGVFPLAEHPEGQ